MSRLNQRLQRYGYEVEHTPYSEGFRVTEEEKEKARLAREKRIADKKAKEERSTERNNVLKEQLMARDKAKKEEIQNRKEARNTVVEIGKEKAKEKGLPFGDNTSRYKTSMQRPNITQTLSPEDTPKRDNFNSIFQINPEINKDKYKRFAVDLSNDLMAGASYYGGVVGNKPIEIETLWNDYIKPKQPENYVETRLAKIEKGLKIGEEGIIQSVQEGWWEREVQNLLSMEELKKMDGEANKVELIEQWLADHPEIQDFIPENQEKKMSTSYYGLNQTDDNKTWYEFKTGALRDGFGGITRLGFDSLRNASLDPETYAWSIALSAVAILSAPATGGLSLGALPLTASAPMLASKMGTALKVANSLKGFTGVAMGMRKGATEYMAQLETAGSYQDLIGNGVDPRIAKEIAPTIGAFNGLVEQAQFSVALKGLPSVMNAVKKAEKVVTNEAVKGLAKVFAEYGKTLSSEVAEEIVQGLITYGGTSIGIGEMESQLRELSEGLAPLPKTLQDYVDFKNSGYERETVMDVVINNGMQGLKSFWAMPLGSTMIQSTGIIANQAIDSKRTKSMEKQINTIDEIERNDKVEEINIMLEAMVGDKGQIDTVIDDVNATKDPRSVAYLIATKQNFQANQNKGFTSEQKDKMVTKIAEIDETVDKVMREAKEQDPNIEFASTDKATLEIEILEDGYIDNNKTSLNEKQIELFKLAQKEGQLEQIRQGLAEGKMKIEIEKGLRKKLRFNRRNVSDGVVDRIQLIRAVEAVDNEVRDKAVANSMANVEKSLEYMKQPTAKVDAVENEATEGDLTQEGGAGGDYVEGEDINATQTSDSPQTASKIEQEEVREEKIDLPETQTPQAEKTLPKSTLQDVQVTKAKVADIKFDPKTFQFRFDKGNQAGSDSRLSDVEWKTFNEGVVTLYQNKYNDVYVVNGHNRIYEMQRRGIEEVNAKVLSYEDFTPEQARAIGAGENIAEGNATSLDVAKILRDTEATKESLVADYGVSPTSKILRDGEALSGLNEAIFNKVVTKGIGIERAVIIGKQLGGMEDAQNTLIKSLAKVESKGKNITNDVLTELIAHARGMKQDSYETVTLFGTETMTKDYTIERAELVSYVKNQLKSKKNLLKNISKDKNAVILQELGNKIAVDENVKNMEIADQALWILDKTINYEGTTTNQLFNDLAKEYANADNKTAIKKKALDMLVKEMEGNKLLDETINQKVKEADLKTKIDQAKEKPSKEQQVMGLEDRIEEDNTPTRKPRIEYLKEQDPVVVVASNEAMKEKSYTGTIDIVEMMGQNPLFNGLTVEYTDELGEVELGKGELIARGYADLADKLEQGETRIYKEKGYFKSGRNTIYLNRSATRSTIIEEAIHYAQQEVGNLSHTYAEAIKDWEIEVRFKADELGLAIPEGKETLAKALLHSEYGYASENPTVAKIFAVDQDILNIFEDLLGKDMIAQFKGESFTKDPKVIRPLNIAKLRQILSFKGRNHSVLAPNTDGVYAQVYNQEGEVSAEFFSNQFGYLKTVDYTSMEDAVTQLANSNIYQLKEVSNEYDRSVVDELSRVKFEDGEVNITPNGFRKIREGILTGNFVRNDYDNLVKDNPSLTPFDREILLNHLLEAEKKGLSKPNSEVTLKEFLYRFNKNDIAQDNEISIEEVRKNYLYYIDSTKEKTGLPTDTGALMDIKRRLENQHKYFQKSVETYRNNGLQYQIEEDRVVDEVFYVGNEIEVIKNPSNKVYQDMYKEFRREYPNAPIGEPYIRTTYDMSGNKYIWSSNYTHSQVEPYINKKFDTQTNQNKDINYQLTETSPINAEGFYSKLENHIRSNKMPNKGIGSDLYNILKKVTTQEEMEWFNLEQINNNEKYTREDILSIMNERPIDITENKLATFREYTLTKGQGLNDYTFKAYSYLNLGDYEYKNSAHFGNLKNVVAHTRYHSVDGILTNERGQQVGKNQKVMLIEELQSDLHTQGRDKGYLTTELEAEYDSKIAELREKHDNAEKVLDRDKYYNEIIDLMNEKFDKAPDAPFKKGAIEFMFKQNIKDAVMGGYDGIAWTTGLQQAERWEYDGEGTGFYGSLYDAFLPRIIKKFAKKYGGEYTTTTIDLNKKIEGESADANEIIYNLSSMFFRNETNMFDYAYDKSLVFEQPYMAITDEMRKMVIEEGQPIFQLEEVSDDSLMATHSLREGELQSALKLGGFPMASIAISKQQYDHNRYGDITLLFNKDTIDPRKNRDNRVYSGDAYTPNFPTIALKISETVADRIETKISNFLNSKEGYREAFRPSLDYDNLQDQINRHGSFVKAYQNETALKLAYLNDNNIDFEVPMRDTKYLWENEVMDVLVKAFGNRLEDGYMSVEDYKMVEPSIRELMNDKLREVNAYIAQMPEGFYKEEIGYGNLDRLLQETRRYKAEGNKMVVDIYATRDKLDETIDQNNYIKWLEQISEGIIEKEGIRNNKDFFTRTGNRRSWETLHDPVTIENVLKTMKEQDEVAGEAFGGIGVFMASVSTTFKSIQEIKANADRINAVDPELYKEMKDEHQGKLLELATRLSDKRESNQFIAIDRALEAMVDALTTSRTKKGITSVLNEYSGMNVTDALVDDIMALGYEVSQMPTEYFEAKPRRIIGLDEVRAVVVPNDIDPATIQLLKENNIHTIGYYDSEIAMDRNKVINELAQVEDVLFQLTEEQNETMDEYYNKAVSNDKEYLSWIKTLNNNPNISDEMKELISNREFKYSVIHNLDTMAFASRALEKYGDEYWEGVIRNPDVKGNPIDFAISQLLTFKFMQNGETQRAMRIAEDTARKAKTLGQAIQILSVLGRQTPEGMLRYVSGFMGNLTTQSQKDLLNLQTEDVIEAFEKIDKEALKGIDFTEGAGQLSFLKDDRGLIQKISDIANLYYKERNFNLAKELSKLGLEEDGVGMVERFIRTKIDIATRKKKQDLLSKNFDKQSYERKGLDDEIIETVNKGGMDAVRGLLAEKTGMPIFTEKDAQWVYERSMEINQMEDGTREKDVAIAQLLADIGNLVPVDKWQKISLLQTMAQLMNAKTILRNLIGNGMFGLVDTVTHNYVGVPIDMLASAFTGERTAVHRGIWKIFKEQAKGYRQGFALGLEDAKLGIDTFDTEVSSQLGGRFGKMGNKYDIRGTKTFLDETDKLKEGDYSFGEKARVHSNAVLSKLETALNVTMRATDRAAFMASYMDSINEQLTLQKVENIKDLSPTQQEEIIGNATALGLYRTFNDNTILSKGFRGIKKYLNVFSSTITGTETWGLGDLVLKYPKTPANILQRIVDYSPLGLIQTMLLLKRQTDMSGYLKQKMVVDSLSRFLSGTSTALIGATLAYMGILTGGESDDPDKIYDLKKQEGLRDYGVNVSALNRWLFSATRNKESGLLLKGDLIVSYDWVEPMAVPLAVGADMLLNGKDSDIVQAFIDASATGISALTEQPLLTGLTQMFGYGDLTKGIGKRIMDIPASFTPTILGHIAGVFHGENKDPYTGYSDLRVAYNRIINKLPIAKGTLPDRYSVFGEKLMYTPEDEGLIGRIFRNILSPAFYDRYSPSDEVEYIIDLYYKTGNVDVVPKKPQTQYTFNGKVFELSPEEFETMSEWLGTEANNRIKQTLDVYNFKNWDINSQEEEIRYVLKELAKEARVKVETMRDERVE